MKYRFTDDGKIIITDINGKEISCEVNELFMLLAKIIREYQDQTKTIQKLLNGKMKEEK